MRDPLFWVPIKYKLPLTFAVLCLFAFGVGGFVVASTAEKALETQIRARLDDYSDVTTAAVDKQLELLGRRVEDFASDGYIRTNLGLLVTPLEGRERTIVESRLRTHLIKNKLPLVDEFVDASLTDRQGTLVLSAHGPWRPRPASTRTETLWYGPLESATGRRPYPAFVISTPVTSIEDRSPLGFLQLLVRADRWLTRLRDRHTMRKVAPVHIVLRDPAGKALLLSPGEDVPVADPRSIIGYTTKIPLNRWTLELAVDRDRAMAPIRGMLQEFLLVGLLLLVPVVVVLFFPMRFLLRPLNALRNAAQRVTKGDFTARLAEDSHDEIGLLQQAFNIMTVAIEERTRKLEESAAVLARREADIRFERDRLNALIRSMQDGVFILDLDGKVTLSNAAARPVLRAFNEGGHDLRRLACRRTGPKRTDCLHCLADPSRPREICTFAVGARIYEIKATTLPGAGGAAAGRVFVSRDVTERVAQAERQSHQERMAVLGQIAAVVAHELNNPLAAVAMFSQMLEPELKPTPSLHQQAVIIRRNAETCKRTVRGLLDLAARETWEMVEFDAQDLLADVQHFLRPLYERAAVKLILEPEARQSVVVGSELQLRQVLVNLVMNAIQAGENAGTTVTITTRDAPGHLVIRVSDTGPGVPPEVQPHIFDPFFTTKPPGVGTGLGLPTSRRIVEMHGGKLTLVSSRPKHTVFELILPRPDGSQRDAPAAHPARTGRAREETGEPDGTP